MNSERSTQSICEIWNFASEEKNNEEIIDDATVIGPITEENATKELLNSKNNTLIYHTSKEQVVVKIRRAVGLRRTI